MSPTPNAPAATAWLTVDFTLPTEIDELLRRLTMYDRTLGGDDAEGPETDPIAAPSMCKAPVWRLQACMFAMFPSGTMAPEQQTSHDTLSGGEGGENAGERRGDL